MLHGQQCGVLICQSPFPYHFSNSEDVVKCCVLLSFTQFIVKYFVTSCISSFVQYSAKLLKKPDQCRAVYACSHLFWVEDQDGVKDGER